MRNLNIYAKKCMEKLDNIGIEYGNILSFSINTRAKNRWGQCCKTPNGFTININSCLLDERNPEESLIDTLIHEILHTCKNCLCHTGEWLNLAKYCNKVLGTHVQRCTSAEDKHLVISDIGIKQIKHVFICEGCGQRLEYFRDSKFTKNYTKYRCGICKSSFKEVF